jgi:hypothetical protein
MLGYLISPGTRALRAEPSGVTSAMMPDAGFAPARNWKLMLLRYMLPRPSTTISFQQGDCKDGDELPRRSAHHLYPPLWSRHQRGRRYSQCTPPHQFHPPIWRVPPCSSATANSRCHSTGQRRCGPLSPPPSRATRHQCQEQSQRNDQPFRRILPHSTEKLEDEPRRREAGA